MARNCFKNIVLTLNTLKTNTEINKRVLFLINIVNKSQVNEKIEQNMVIVHLYYVQLITYPFIEFISGNFSRDIDAQTV